MPRLPTEQPSILNTPRRRKVRNLIFRRRLSLRLFYGAKVMTLAAARHHLIWMIPVCRGCCVPVPALTKDGQTVIFRYRHRSMTVLVAQASVRDGMIVP